MGLIFEWALYLQQCSAHALPVIKQFLLFHITSYGNQTVLSTQPVAAEYRSQRRTARLRRSAVPEIWLVPSKIQMVHVT